MKHLLTQAKKRTLFISLLMSSYAVASCPEPFGIVGGGTVAPQAYLIDSNGNYSQQLLPSLGLGSVTSVSMNGAATGFIGGVSGVGAFAYYVYPNGQLSNQLLPPGISSIASVSLNDAGVALLGGTSGGNASAYLVQPNWAVSPNLLSTTGGQIFSVAINALGNGIVGGVDGNPSAIAYVVSPNGTVSSQLLPGGLGGQTKSVAINADGTSIVGGINGSSNAFAYLVGSSGSLSSQLLPSISGSVTSVDINNSNVSLIGGDSGGGSPFAYLVYQDGTVSSQLLPTLPVAQVSSVALNDAQVGLIGGTTGFSPMLYYLYPNATLSAQLLPSQLGMNVVEVAINEFSTGLALATDGFNSLAYLVAPNGSITVMYPQLSDAYNSAAMVKALSQVVTVCLNANSLTVAKYINKYAPEKASYFLPSLVDGSLPKAVQSVAPMRNAATLITAHNNLFLMNQSLSRHLRSERYVRLYDWSGSEDAQTAAEFTSQLYAALDLALAQGPKHNPQVEKTKSDDFRPYTFWGEILNAFSYQKAEHQTPGFDPITGGLILGFDVDLNHKAEVGGGAAYAYTHIHQDHGSGQSHMNQEYLFAYGLWGNKHLYVDAAIWGGLFQIHQVRNIHMTGFEFRSTSDPSGWQFSPHFEIGGDFYPRDSWLTLEPFAMFDWTSAWQGAYKEKGSGPFNMGQKHHYSSFLRSEVGIRFYESIAFKSWRLTFEEKASYVNKKPFKVGTVNAFLVGSPGAFTVETFTTPQNLGVGEFAMICEPLDLRYPYGTISYQGEFSVPYQSHQILLELSWCY